MLAILSLFSGALIALQATVNSSLGVMLKNSLAATTIAFLVSAFTCIVALLLRNETFPQFSLINKVPFFYWLGGLASALGVALFYYLIPKMGVANMMTFALTGQLIMAIVIAHFGLFNSTVVPISTIKIIGVFAMVLGLLLINKT